jgi:hypothetical protein
MFHYSSSQVHEVVENGVKKSKRNTVNISNGKGTKTVELTENGKTRKSTKKLSNAEIQKIQKNEFIPGLFKECHDCLNTSTGGSRSSGTQTRRNTKKKSRSRK